MKILTWESQNAPPQMRWTANVLEAGSVCPVRFFAATEDEVVAKADTFWAAEKKKALERAGKKRPKKAATTAPPAGDDDDEEAIG